MHKVILVDDEIYTRTGLRNLINWEACGFQVVDEADNGEDALALIEEQQPDLVITDIRMPVMDGLELIRLARERIAAPPSFIIISGYDDFAYAQQAVRYGVADFILKPIDEKVLEPTLRQLNDKLLKAKQAKSQSEQLYNERFVPLMIKGEATDEAIAEWLKDRGMTAEGGFRYVLAEVNDVHPWREDGLSLQPGTVRAGIGRALKELLSLKQDPYIHEHSKRSGFILPMASLDADQLDIARFAGKLQTLLSDRLQTPVYIYVGKPVRHLRELGRSYESATNASLFKFIEESPIVYDRLANLNLNYVDLDQSLSDRLIEQIEEYDLPAVQKSIDVIFKEFQNQRYAPEAVKLAIHHCATGIIKIMTRMEINKSEVPSLQSILAWQDLALTPEELKRMFAKFISESAEALSKHRKESVKGSIQKVKAYIESNYHENIS